MCARQRYRSDTGSDKKVSKRSRGDIAGARRPSSLLSADIAMRSSQVLIVVDNSVSAFRPCDDDAKRHVAARNAVCSTDSINEPVSGPPGKMSVAYLTAMRLVLARVCATDWNRGWLYIHCCTGLMQPCSRDRAAASSHFPLCCFYGDHLRHSFVQFLVTLSETAINLECAGISYEQVHTHAMHFIFSERELCYRPSVCRLSSVCRL